MTATRYTRVDVDLEKVRRGDNGLNYVAAWTAATVEDVPNLFNDRVPPIPLCSDPSSCQCIPASEIEKNLWEIKQPHRNPRYVTLGSNGELWVKDGMPNTDYAPNIFGLAHGNQSDQFILHTFGMLPNDGDCQYALTVVPEDGRYKLKYCNEDIDAYQWCFLTNYRDDNIALQWCSPDDMGGSRLVLCLDESDPMHPQISVTDLRDQPSDHIPYAHFLHNFHSL